MLGVCFFEHQSFMLFCLVFPAPYPVVVDLLSLPWYETHDRLLGPTALEEPTPAKYLEERSETTRRKIEPSRPFRPTRLTDDRKTLARALPEMKATRIGLRYTDGRTVRSEEHTSELQSRFGI